MKNDKYNVTLFTPCLHGVSLPYDDKWNNLVKINPFEFQILNFDNHPPPLPDVEQEAALSRLPTECQIYICKLKI